MKRASLAAALACLVLAACATKRLPPGTPPPEYETRVFPPWPPASAAASASTSPSAASASVAPSEAEPPPNASRSDGKTAPGPSPSAAGE